MNQNENNNWNESINLLRLKNVLITECKGRTETKKGLFIPIEDNDLFVSFDENLKPKSIILSLTAWALKEEGKFGDTHLIKQSFSKEFREAMSEEELKNQPILGNMKPMVKTEPIIESQTQVVPSYEDLPF